MAEWVWVITRQDLQSGAPSDTSISVEADSITAALQMASLEYQWEPHLVITDVCVNGTAMAVLDFVRSHACDPPMEPRPKDAGDWTCSRCGRRWHPRGTSESDTFFPEGGGEAAGDAVWERVEEP
jgi:hypothetical protein